MMVTPYRTSGILCKSVGQRLLGYETSEGRWVSESLAHLKCSVNMG